MAPTKGYKAVSARNEMALKKICVITASRAEYGLLRWVMQDIQDAASMHLQLIVTGSHLSAAHGMTVVEIETDGFVINERIPMALEDTSTEALSISTGELTKEMARSLSRLQPDLVLFLGDRYELMAVISACVIMTIPMAHIAGGEITQGAIDEQIRHAISKMAHLHFVANETYAKRVRQMGEESWRICVSGEPGLDTLHRQELLDCGDLSADLGIDFSEPTALVTYHPVTLELDELDRQLSALSQAMEVAQEQNGIQYLITHPGADAGNDRVVSFWQKFVAQKPNRKLVANLGYKRYFSALRYATLMLGNSSSGIIETPSFNLPTVNIGNRQGGRMQAGNVIDVDCEAKEIIGGIVKALEYDRSSICENPYGDGCSAARIVGFIERSLGERNRGALLSKKFIDL
jgi:GDP/UDP-N,N'-diacetylbacillosamine 2-epimerase (hydrolysing)